MQREKSQVSEAPVRSGHADTSTSGAHASPHASTSYFSHGRRVSPINASLLPSFHKCQISPIQKPEVPEAPVPPPKDDTSEPVPPPAANADELVSPLDGEDAELEPFRGGPIELSLLPLYPYHTIRHI